jgi:hypothetical protein
MIVRLLLLPWAAAHYYLSGKTIEADLDRVHWSLQTDTRCNQAGYEADSARVK